MTRLRVAQPWYLQLIALIDDRAHRHSGRTGSARGHRGRALADMAQAVHLPRLSGRGTLVAQHRGHGPAWSRHTDLARATRAGLEGDVSAPARCDRDQDRA